MISFEQRPAYLFWANSRLGTSFSPDGTATTLTALDQDGSILGVVIFSRFTPWGCELTAATDTASATTRRLIRASMLYVFVQCELGRLTAFIPVDNEKSLNRAQRLGFRIEGRARAWFGDRDAFILGLLRDECTWIKDRNGQPLSAAST